MQGFRAEEMGSVEEGGAVGGWVFLDCSSMGRDWEGRSGEGGASVESEHSWKQLGRALYALSWG